MNKIDEKELKKISGGGMSGWTIASISALAAFVVGIFDGIVHPKRCA